MSHKTGQNKDSVIQSYTFSEYENYSIYFLPYYTHADSTKA